MDTAVKTSPTHANCTLSKAQKCNDSPSVLASVALALLYHFSSLTRICLFLSQMHISFFCVQVLCPRSLANSAYEWQTIVSLSLQTHVVFGSPLSGIQAKEGKSQRMPTDVYSLLLLQVGAEIQEILYDSGTSEILTLLKSLPANWLTVNTCIPQLRAPSFSLSHCPYLKGKRTLLGQLSAIKTLVCINSFFPTSELIKPPEEGAEEGLQRGLLQRGLQ